MDCMPALSLAEESQPGNLDEMPTLQVCVTIIIMYQLIFYVNNFVI